MASGVFASCGENPPRLPDTETCLTDGDGSDSDIARPYRLSSSAGVLG